VEQKKGRAAIFIKSLGKRAAAPLQTSLMRLHEFGLPMRALGEFHSRVLIVIVTSTYTRNIRADYVVVS